MLRALALLPFTLLLLVLISPPLTAAAPLSLLRRAAAAVGAGATAADAAAVQWPIELQNLTWTSERGAILLNGQQFHLKGVIWFGLESETRAPHGLWAATLDDIVTFLANNKFNAIRLPISLAVARDPTLPVPRSALGCDRSLQNVTTIGQLLDRILESAADRGILVVLTLHSVGSGRPAGLWYSFTSSAQDFLQAWRAVLSRYVAGNSRHWNVLGIDLLHRPGRGRGKWGDDDPSCDWNLAAQDTAVRLLREFAGSFQGLCIVQGIEGGQWAANYATDLRGARQHPLTLSDAALDRRLVYAALVMGPSVNPSMNFVYSMEWPQNLYAAYDELFGFVEGETGRALIVSKWGGAFNDDQQGDAIWQRAVADYLAAHCLDDTFYWAINPNSADTGGLLGDDWCSPNEDKLALLARLQPQPSTILKAAAIKPGGGFLFTQGSAANAACNV